MFTLRVLLRPHHLLSIASLTLFILTISWDQGETSAETPSCDRNWIDNSAARQLSGRFPAAEYYLGDGTVYRRDCQLK